MIYNIFGSSNSDDYDIMVVVPEVPKNKELCKELCAGYTAMLKDVFLDKDINVNICQIEQEDPQTRRIVKVYKGTPDECNNSLYYTYLIHKQYCTPIVTVPVQRNVELKVARALRIILTFMSRVDGYRPKIKMALASKNSAMMYTVLREINLDNDVPEQALYEKGIDYITFQKKVAFQFGQVMGLIDGKEIYTRIEILNDYDHPSYCNSSLEDMKKQFCDKLDNSGLDWDKIKE